MVKIIITILVALFPMTYIRFRHDLPMIVWLCLGSVLYGISIIRLIRYNQMIKIRWCLPHILWFSLLFAILLYLYPKPIFLLYPFIVSLIFFGIFGLSLLNKTPIITQIASLRGHKLTQKAKQYTKKLTYLWLVFFIFNGFFIVILSLLPSPKWWGIYTGLISYILMGILFLGDIGYRFIFLKNKDDLGE